MKKKYGLFFLILGIISIVLFSIYNNRDNKNSNISSIEIIRFDYIKSHDMQTKVKVSYPVLKNFIDDKQYDGEFMRKYYSEDEVFYYDATIYETKQSLDNFSKEKDILFNENYSDTNYKKVISDIKCKYMCKKYQVYKNDILMFERLIIYIKTSDKDIAEITYYSPQNEIPNDIVNGIIDNITVTKDTNY